MVTSRRIAHQLDAGDSRNKTRPAKVVVVANSNQKVFSWTHNVVKYTPKNFGYDYTLYCVTQLHAVSKFGRVNEGRKECKIFGIFGCRGFTDTVMFEFFLTKGFV